MQTVRPSRGSAATTPGFASVFFFNDTATTEIYTLPYTTLFRSRHRAARDRGLGLLHLPHPCRGADPGSGRRLAELRRLGPVPAPPGPVVAAESWRPEREAGSPPAGCCSWPGPRGEAEEPQPTGR